MCQSHLNFLHLLVLSGKISPVDKRFRYQTPAWAVQCMTVSSKGRLGVLHLGSGH